MTIPRRRSELDAHVEYLGDQADGNTLDTMRLTVDGHHVAVTVLGCRPEHGADAAALTQTGDAPESHWRAGS